MFASLKKGQPIQPTVLAMPVNTVLVLLLAYSLADMSWRMLSQPVTPVVSVESAVPDSSTARPVLSLSEVAKFHLLGEVGTAPEQNPKPVEAPETRLNLKLKGLFALHTPDEAMAIIATNGGNEKSYRVGDTIAGAATVHQIFADRVILKRGERFETLTLPKNMLEGILSSAAGNRSTGRENTSVRSLPGVRERILRNPQQAFSLINARPVMDGGQLKGYRVSPGRERALFAKAGLRPNDVVTQVNGISLSDSSQLGKLMQQFRTSPRITLTVERAGRPLSLALDLQ